MKIIGLDLSLVSTGYAVVEIRRDNLGAGNLPGGGGWWSAATDRITSAPRKVDPHQLQRLRDITDAVGDVVRAADLVVVEGLALASQTGQALTRAGLWHLVMLKIDAAGIPWLVATPQQVKCYATGRGNAHKDEVMIETVRRYPQVQIANNDECDAFVLAAMGAAAVGRTLVEVPGTHRSVVAKLAVINPPRGTVGAWAPVDGWVGA